MRQKLKTALALVGLSVVVIVGADLLGRVAAAVDDRYFGPPADLLLADDDLRAGLPAYYGVDYDPRELLEEVRKSDRAVYEPYTIWKRRPYRGTHTTIDITGSRRTVGNTTSEDALDIWMFGGSAVWGVGAPDHETIPSHLAALLDNTLGIESNIRNLGRRGFVSTQEVIFLMRELQAGRRPDIVVFYNGVNDAAAVSLWPEFPGAHVSFDTVRDRFESTARTAISAGSRARPDSTRRRESSSTASKRPLRAGRYHRLRRPRHRLDAELPLARGAGHRPLALQRPRHRRLGPDLRVHTPDGVPARTMVDRKAA